MIRISQLCFSTMQPRVAQPHRWAVFVSAQYLRSLSFLICAAVTAGCNSEPTNRVSSADPTDGAVFAALFASHPGLGARAAVALKPSIMGSSGTAEVLPAG